MTRALRITAVAACLLALAGCRPGRDPGLLVGRWENARDSIQFLTDGRVVLSTPAGRSQGTFRRLSRDHIEVELGARWPSGDPQRWHAIAERGRLAVCELRNGRHCMMFRRPGSTTRLVPR